LALGVLVLAVGALVRTPSAPAAGPAAVIATASAAPAARPAVPATTIPATTPPSAVPSASLAEPVPPALGTETAGWTHVLAALSERRTTALMAADDALLSGVYVDTATPRQADADTIAELRVEGVRPDGLATTVVSATVIESGAASAGGVTLRMVDTRAAYDLVDATGAVVRSVPARDAQAWRVRLVAEHGEWQIASIAAAS
jgi:hypothetical protein